MGAPRYNLAWRKHSWEHRERVGQRCRMVRSTIAGPTLFEFQDGTRLVADHDCAIRPPRIKWKTLPKRQLRESLYRAADYTCARCGLCVPPADSHDGLTAVPGLQIDHILPLAQGGTNDVSNLQVLCEPCNRHKGARILEPVS